MHAVLLRARVGCDGARCTPQSPVHLAGERSALECLLRWLLCVPLSRAAFGFMTVRFNLRLLYACWHHLVSCTNGSAHDFFMIDGMPQATGPTTEPRARMRLVTTYSFLQASPLPNTQSGQPPPLTRTESARGHRSGKVYEHSLVRTCSRFRVRTRSTRTWRFALTISHIIRKC